MSVDAAWLRSLVRDIPDWPRPGVTFRDITPLLADAAAFRGCIDAIADRFARGLADEGGGPVDRVLGAEARGFIVAAPVAHRLDAGFVPVRKAGKLPWEIEAEEYALEYGEDLLEIHRDGVHPGQRVLVVDDVLATGGTAAACVRLVERLGGVVVGVAVLLELADLGGRAALAGHDVVSLVRYGGGAEG